MRELKVKMTKAEYGLWVEFCGDLGTSCPAGALRIIASEIAREKKRKEIKSLPAGPRLVQEEAG